MLEEQLRELRRSLGVDDGPAQVRARPVPVAVAAPVAAPVAAAPEPVLESVPDPVFDPVLDAAPEPVSEPAPQISSRGPARLPAAGRRGLGADLFLLAGAWAGLILLVVFVLGRSS
jgi:hypothetical protein